MCLRYILILVALLTTITSHANERERIALVIGNADYQTSPLTNTLNDARDIASTLESLDFNVTLIEDANHEQMGDAIENFEKKLNNDTVGLFYYSGHAIQYKGSNYLIPLGTNINRASLLKYRTIDLGEVQEALEQSQSQLNFVFLDACRNSPFRGFSRGIESGLIKTSSSRGILNSYSTSPGSIAADGDGRNSPFTKHLLEEITKPNIEVELMLKQVTANVSLETRGDQTPWYESSITGKFCFKVVNDNCGKVSINVVNINSSFLQGLSDVETLTLEDDEIYHGQVKDGKPHGKGILNYADGGRYEGEYKDGKRHDKGILNYADGDRYEGDFKDGKKHGKGIYTWADGNRYEGEFKDGEIQGKGILTLLDGRRYEGDFKDGLQYGKGITTWADGGRYEGEFKDGKKHGKGIYTWPDGRRYEGEYKDGKKHGKGIATSPDGIRYEGEWKDGEMYGKGIYTWPDGRRYEGEYKDGKKHGKGIATSPDGIRYEGEWKDGEMYGKGILNYANGDRYEGDFKDGEAHGKGIEISSNGDRYEGEFKDGDMHGKGIQTWPDGRRHKGDFKNGYFSGNGEVIEIFNWEDGGRYEGDYKDWKPHGKGIFTFDNGRRYEDDVIEKMYKDYVDSLNKEDDQTAKMLRLVLLLFDEERVLKLENITQQESQTKVEPEQIFLDGKNAYNNGDYKTAFIIWEPLAAQGHPRAQFFLAKMYLNGWGVPPNQDKAVFWLKKAAAMNHKGAAKKLENLQIINKAEPVTQLTFEDEQAFKEGMNAYRKFDYPAAFIIWEPLALSGFPEAQYFLGIIYFDGRGVRVDKAKAERWFRKAAEQGHVEARKELICIFENKQFSLWYSLANKHPNAQLKYNLGLRYLDGKCGTEDKTEAIIWLTKASIQGHEEASIKLKLLKSIPFKAFKDGLNAYYQNKYPTSYTLLEPLAKKGDSIAKYYVGLMLSNGWGVAKNNKEAIRLLTEAADQGHEKASKELNLLKQEKVTEQIPLNAYALGSGWTCNYGYKKSGNKCVLKKLPSISHLDSELQYSINSACSYARTKGPVPVKYIERHINISECLSTQLTQLGFKKLPSMSHLDAERQGSINSACSYAKTKGPAKYIECLITKLNIPPNAHASDSGWVCNINFYRNSDRTGCIRVPANAYSRYDSDIFLCNSGYTKNGKKCEVKVPNNAYASYSGWSCKSGYIKSGNKCTKKATVQMHPNTHASGELVEQPVSETFQDGSNAYHNGDYETAFIILAPLAEQGNSMAQYYIARMYSEGWGVRVDKSEALRWFKKAADQGHEIALEKLKLLQQEVVAQEDILNELKVSYASQIASRIKSLWRYQGTEDGWSCQVYILQDVNGVVQRVNLESCATDDSTKAKLFKDSIERAIYKASPLPIAPNEEVFDEEVFVEFRVD